MNDIKCTDIVIPYQDGSSFSGAVVFPEEEGLISPQHYITVEAYFAFLTRWKASIIFASSASQFLALSAVRTDHFSELKAVRLGSRLQLLIARLGLAVARPYVCHRYKAATVSADLSCCLTGLILNHNTFVYHCNNKTWRGYAAFVQAMYACRKENKQLNKR